MGRHARGKYRESSEESSSDSDREYSRRKKRTRRGPRTPSPPSRPDRRSSRPRHRATSAPQERRSVSPDRSSPSYRIKMAYVNGQPRGRLKNNPSGLAKGSCRFDTGLEPAIYSRRAPRKEERKKVEFQEKRSRRSRSPSPTRKSHGSRRHSDRAQIEGSTRGAGSSREAAGSSREAAGSS